MVTFTISAKPPTFCVKQTGVSAVLSEQNIFFEFFFSCMAQGPDNISKKKERQDNNNMQGLHVASYGTELQYKEQSVPCI